MKADVELSAEWKRIVEAISQPPPSPANSAGELVDWAVSAGGQYLDPAVAEEIRTQAPVIQQIREQAADQAVADVFGADWKEHVDVHGNPVEQGIGSTAWLLNVEEHRAQQHYAAIERFHGPGAAKAERERITRLKAARGK
jgi:hypothetical protein